MMADVLIIGAGVTGGMIARELTKYQLQVCLLEKENDVACGASKANSGIIHGGYDPEPGTLKAKLNTEGVELLYEAARQLQVPHINNGSMIVAFGPEQAPALEELYLRGQENGIRQLALISGEEARALEPMLSPEITRVLLVPTAGIICPYELTIAAVGNAMDNGAQLLRNFQVTAIEKEGAEFLVTAADGRQVRGRYVINCAGAFADRIARMVGDDSFRIIPRAGEYMLLDKNEGSRVKHTIFQVPSKEGKGILVSPTVDGNLLTGPTATAVAQPEDTDTTPQGLEVVARLAAKSVPQVDFRQVITSFSGVRASEKSGDYIIRPAAHESRFLQVAAIDSPGLTSCVAIARYVMAMLAQQGLQLQENPEFNGTRPDPHAFRHMDTQARDAWIQTHPAYGKIVCRCETVSEGEILDAIRRNPRALDVDGVKRRTRSGMGRCQGGFCAPFVMQLLARENGLSLEQVTKKGPGSAMVTGKL